MSDIMIFFECKCRRRGHHYVAHVRVSLPQLLLLLHASHYINRALIVSCHLPATHSTSQPETLNCFGNTGEDRTVERHPRSR